MRNLHFELSEKHEIQKVRWTRRFIRKIFKKNFESKNQFWRKTAFPLSPIENFFAGNSVQLILNFHIPQSPSMQEILIDLQAKIYPDSKEKLKLHNNAIKATLKMIGEQSQTIILDGKCVSFFGHKENFCHVNRFTVMGNLDWPFEFQRAMVQWDAFTEEAEADILLTVDYFMDLSKIETATWMSDGQLRIPIEDIELEFDSKSVMEKEKLPLLLSINDEEILEISSGSMIEE